MIEYANFMCQIIQHDKDWKTWIAYPVGADFLFYCFDDIMWNLVENDSRFVSLT